MTALNSVFLGTFGLERVYALRNKNCPIGVANFETELIDSLPDNLKTSLPTIEEIEAEATLYAQKAKMIDTSEDCRDVVTTIQT